MTEATDPRLVPPRKSGLAGWRPGRRRAALEAKVCELRAALARERRDAAALRAALAHDLRTPLAALAGELETTLRRERPAESYRAALAHMAGSVDAALELVGDLSVFDDDEGSGMDGEFGLDRALGAVAARCAPPRLTGVAIDPDPPAARIAGKEAQVTRALVLLVEHAARHRAEGGAIRVQVGPDVGDRVELTVDAAPPRFPGRTWAHLDPEPDDASARASGLFRLRTAARLLERCGASLSVHSSDGSDALRVRLRRPRGKGGPTP